MYTLRFVGLKVRVAAISSLLGAAACSGDGRDQAEAERGEQQAEATGEVTFSLSVDGEPIVGGVRYQITGNAIAAVSGVMEEVDQKTVSATVNLPAGTGYQLILAAYRANGQQACVHMARFNVVAGGSTTENLTLQCSEFEQGDTLDGGRRDAGRDGGADAGREGGAATDAALNPEAGSDSGGAQDAGLDAARDAGPRPDAGGHDDAGGGGANDGGVPVRDAGHDGGGSEPDSGPSSCEVCSQRECGRVRGVDRLSDCYAASGVASGGPAQGVAKSSLCVAAVDCAHRSACVFPAIQDCFCGAGVGQDECVRRTPNGTCRTEFENASQQTNAARVLGAFGNPNVALGPAVRILECEVERCRAECYPGR